MGTAIAEWMQRAGVAFGTSGARGRVDDLSNALCYGLSRAFVGHIGHPPAVVVGGDRRPSTPRIAAAVEQALVDLGVAVRRAGIAPTPCIAAFGLRHGLPSIAITGSHVPEDRNGIKLYTASGEITKADEAAIVARPAVAPGTIADVGPWSPDCPAHAEYRDRFVSAWPAGALRGLSVGAYGHSAAGRELTAEVLEALGAEVRRLGDSDTFVAVDTEAVREEDHRLAAQWSAAYRLDAIVTTDGDGDRPLIADEHGRWQRGDVIGILAAAELGARVVVTPVSSNTAVERCGWFHSVVRTRIGSPYVIAGMEAATDAPVVGYEANGGLLQGSPVTIAGGGLLLALPTRDALVVLVTVLARAAREGRSLSALVGELPPRYTASDRVKGIDSARARAWLAELQQQGEDAMARVAGLDASLSELDTTDGLRMTFGSDIVHLRPSGNAPELRCYAEADRPERAAQLVAHALRQAGRALP